jgi:hypothetical protein
MLDAHKTVSELLNAIDWTQALKEPLTQERLKKILDYNPYTGIFKWKTRPANNGGVKVGDIAGNFDYSRPSGPYVRIGIDGIYYWAHRLAWLWAYGRLPNEVDHIDRVAANNRLDNLIEVSRSTQQFNKRIPENNTSGHKGVNWVINVKKWQARINIGGDGTRVRLGYFNTLEEAVAARKAAEIRLLGCTTEELKDPRNRRPRWRRF